jgi:autotransporter-associated beta strand protein
MNFQNSSVCGVPASRRAGRDILSKILIAGVSVASLSLLAPGSARAADVAWDPDLTPATPSGGSGNWNSIDPIWSDGASDVAWGNAGADTAVFGGATGAVTLDEAINALGLRFTTPDYVLDLGGLTMTLGAGGIDASALSSGSTTIGNGTIALGSAQSWTVGDGSNLAMSSVIQGSSALSKAGAGTLTLSGANTFTGGLTISGGAISVGANANLGANANAITLDGGALRTTAGITNTHPITVGAGGGTISVTTTGQYFFNTANTLLGSGALTVTGNGTLTANTGNLRVAQANTYSGNVTMQAGGIFEYGVANAVASAATFTLGNEGELSVNAGVTLAQAITVNGGTNSVLSFENGTTGTFSGPITLDADVTVGLRDWYNYNTVRSGIISGVISGVGGLSINRGTAASGGQLTLTGTNTYTGGTTIDSGTLVLGHATDTLADTGAVTVNANGVLSIGGNSDTIGALSLQGGSISGRGTLTASSYDLQSGTVTARLAGGVDLTKSGSGSLILSNASNVLGNVTLSQGSLQLAGTAGAVTVADSASNVLTVRALDGSLSASSVAFSGAATANLSTLSGSTAPVISAGALSASGGAGSVTLNVTGTGGFTSPSYDLIGYTGGSIGGNGFGSFAKGTVTGLGVRQTAALADTGSAVALQIGGVTPHWTGAQSSDWTTATIGGSSNWVENSGSATATDFVSGDTVVFDDTAANFAVNVAENVSPTAVLFDNSTNNYTLSSSGGFGVAGTGSMTKSGSGTLTITNTNSFTGGMNLLGGVVAVTSNANLGGATNPITFDGGTLRMVMAASTITNTHVLTIGANGGTINITTPTSGTPTFIMGSAGNLTGNGALTVTGSGTLGIVGSSSSVLVLGNANTGFTGNVTLQDGGILEYATSSGVGTGATFTVNNNGMLSIANGAVVSQAVTVNAGGYLAFQNNGNGVFAGPITLNGAATVRMQNWWSPATQNGTISGVISGSGGLTVNRGTATSGGQLTLTGTNTYTGGTTIDSGTLVLGHATDTLANAGAVMVNANGTLSLGGNSDTVGAVTLDGGSITSATGVLSAASVDARSGTISAILGGGGTLAKTTSGAVTLSGANTFSGGTTVSDGTLTVANASGLGTGAVTLNGGALQTSVAAVNTGSVSLAGGSLTLNPSGAGTLALSAGSTFTMTGGTWNLDLGALDTIAGSATSTFSVTGGTFALSSADVGTFTLLTGFQNSGNTASGSFTFTGLSSRMAASLVNDNDGTLKLTITGDSVRWMGNGSQDWTTSASVENWKTVLGNTATAYIQGDKVQFDDQAAAFAVNLAENVAPTSTTFDNSTNDYTVASTGGFGIVAGAVTKNGTATTVLGTANTYDGATTVNAGTLAITNASALGSTVGGTTVNSGAVLDLRGVSGVAENLTLNGGTLSASTGDSALSGAIGLTADSTVSVGGGATLGLSGIISGAQTLSKTGDGALTLSGANTFTGGVTVNGGALFLGNGSGAGTGAITLMDGTRLAASGAQTISNAVNLSPGASATIGGSGSGALTLGATSALTGNGALTVTTSALNVVNGANTASFSGTITVESALNVQATSAFNGNNSTLDLSNAAVILKNGASMAFNALGGGSTAKPSTGTFRLGSLSGEAGATIGGSSGGDHKGTAFIVGYLNTDTTYAGAIVNGILPATLTKVGSGALTLSGASTFSGGTTINAGSLIAAGASALGAGSLSISGGVFQSAVADVSGVGNVTLSSGSLTINTGGVGTLTLAAGATFTMSGGTWNLDATSLDSIVGSGAGSFAITGGAIDLGNSVIDYNQSYAVLSGFASGSVSGLAITNYDNGNYTASLDSNGVLSFAPVPEPSICLLLGIGLAGVLILGRARRQPLDS